MEILATATFVWVVCVVLALIAFVALGVIGPVFTLWVQALFSGAPISAFNIIGMKLRKVDPRIVVLSRIRAVQAGFDIPVADMERHYISGGSVPEVVTAMVTADRAKVELTWETAAALNLAGRDVMDVARRLANGETVERLADAPAPAPPPPEQPADSDWRVRAGATGEVVRPCGPVGKVVVDGRLRDAVTNGALLEPGAPVSVVRVEPDRVVIEEKKV